MAGESLVLLCLASQPPAPPPPSPPDVPFEIVWTNAWTIVGLVLFIILVVVALWRIFRRCLDLSLERRLVS